MIGRLRQQLETAFADMPLVRKLAVVTLGTCAISLALACAFFGAYEFFEARRSVAGW